MILLSPGPVPVIDEINMAQTKEMITHRSSYFTQIYTNLVTRLKKYYSSYEAYVLTGSGALGVETLILNTCFPDEKIICFSNGEFGEHFCNTAKIYTKLEKVDLVPENFAKGWDLERAKEYIESTDANVLGILQNETGYAVKNDIKDICKYAKKKGMFTLVDGISAWPATEMNMQEFAIDGFVTGSQKSTGAPPGMALLGISKELSERINSRESVSSRYCDLRRHKQRFEKDGQTPNTPAISLFYSLQKAFDILDTKRGGIEQVWKNHETISKHVRQRLTEIGFELIAEKGFESNTVTAFKVDNPKELKRKLLEKGIFIVGCKGMFSENGLRIAHMHYDSSQPSNVDICLDELEKIKRG